MGKHRLSFTERRRASMRMQFVRLEEIEKRAMITEPISVAALSLGLPLGLEAILGLARTHKTSLPGAAARPGQRVDTAPRQGGGTAPGASAKSAAFLDFTIAPRPQNGGGGSGSSSGQVPVAAAPLLSTAGNDWLNLIPQESSGSSGPTGLTPPWHPAARQGAGQAISTCGGGAPAVAATRGAITPLKLAPPVSPASNPGASAALYAAAAGASTPGDAALPHGFGTATAAAPGAQPQTQPQASGPTNAQPLTSSTAASGGTINPNIDPTTSNASPASLGQFQYFPVYVINYNNGSTMMPGAYQLATWSTGVDLRAQVEGTTVSSISWNTSNMPDAGDISGTNTYRLTFGWANINYQYASVNSVTLSVTDVNNHTETFTYDFELPAGDGFYSGGGGSTWPTSLPPDLELSQAPAIASQNVSVDSTSGALDTSINLPSYNPNVPALALTYDSLTADPRPIVVIPHTLNAS